MVYMYHSFLIHSSADGILGCFHVLAMINRRLTLFHVVLHKAGATSVNFILQGKLPEEKANRNENNNHK